MTKRTNFSYRDAERNAICRSCSGDIERGTKMISGYSSAARGMSMHFHPECVRIMVSLIEEDDMLVNDFSVVPDGVYDALCSSGVSVFDADGETYQCGFSRYVKGVDIRDKITVNDGVIISAVLGVAVSIMRVYKG